MNFSYIFLLVIFLRGGCTLQAATYQFDAPLLGHAKESKVLHKSGVTDIAFTLYTPEFAQTHNLPTAYTSQLSEGMAYLELQVTNMPQTKGDFCFLNMLLKDNLGLDDDRDAAPYYKHEKKKAYVESIWANKRLIATNLDYNHNNFNHGRTFHFVSSDYIPSKRGVYANFAHNVWIRNFLDGYTFYSTSFTCSFGRFQFQRTIPRGTEMLLSARKSGYFGLDTKTAGAGTPETAHGEIYIPFRVPKDLVNKLLQTKLNDK